MLISDEGNLNWKNIVWYLVFQFCMFLRPYTSAHVIECYKITITSVLLNCWSKEQVLRYWLYCQYCVKVPIHIEMCILFFNVAILFSVQIQLTVRQMRLLTQAQKKWITCWLSCLMVWTKLLMLHTAGWKTLISYALTLNRGINLVMMAFF